MRYIILIIALVLSVTFAEAQNYLISFSGTGASTNVDSVKVENLTSRTSLKLIGSDILRLTGPTGINSIEDKRSSELKIYPNPMTDNSTVEISSPAAGVALITVHNIAGILLAQNKSYLGIGRQEFCLSGLKSGFYLVNVKGITYQFSGKLVSNGNAVSTITIEQISNNNAAREKSGHVEEADSKGVQTTFDMAYTIGDRLKFTGKSGIYSTVTTDIPTGDKIISFNYVPCTDADNNNYPVVKIGTQTWMAENLKTTKYSDGADIPNTIDNSVWSGLSTGAYCLYENNEGNKAIYGALYNWYAVIDNRKICPIDWRIPTMIEWGALVDYLGGFSFAGGKMKETGTSHWNYPNSGATNESGFTGLPGGYRWDNGAFNSIGILARFYSSNEANSTSAQGEYLYSGSDDINLLSLEKNHGFSIRCIRNFEPIVYTNYITSITGGTAICGGGVTNDGGAAIMARGVCWSTNQNPTILDSKTLDGTGIGTFTSSITGLASGTTYYVRAYATNNIGTGYGTQRSFTTLSPPSVKTKVVTDKTYTSAITGGEVTSSGGTTVTSRGVCWSTNQNPTISDSKTLDGTGTGTFTSSITGLTSGTIYYIRAYAVNIVGVSYGNELKFKTCEVSDADGNTYSTVTIGTQVWLAENLKTSKFSDSTAIPLVTNNISWGGLITPGYCWYLNNKTTYGNTYGALYNWYSVNTGKLCPVGWHVPSDIEWTTLENYLIDNGYNYDGTTTENKIAKALGSNILWGFSSKVGAVGNTDFPQYRNLSDFTALPGGFRSWSDGTFYNIGLDGYWWTSTDNLPGWILLRSISYTAQYLSRGWWDAKGGSSVRCLKDN